MIRVSLLLLASLCSACMVLSHDAYFSPDSAADHELRSPFPGNPWNTFPAFGSPSDIITVELKNARVGLSVRNSATSMAWVGPVFVPLVPIPLRETLQTSQLHVWLAVVAKADIEVVPGELRLCLPDDPTGIPPDGVYLPSLAEVDEAAVNERHHLTTGDRAGWYLAFTLPGSEPAGSFELQVRGITGAGSPRAHTQVEFSGVRGWRILSLP